MCSFPIALTTLQCNISTNDGEHWGWVFNVFFIRLMTRGNDVSTLSAARNDGTVEVRRIGLQ